MRKWSIVTLVFLSIFIQLLGSVWGAEDIRGIKIVAVDRSSQKWVDIPLYNKTYAVVIGIDYYPSLGQDNQLSYAVSDAKAVENLLRNKFIFNKIYTLYNEQATKNNILDLLINKLAKTSDDDAVFVFFAGHGGEEETNYGPIGFLVPYDGDFSDMRKIISMTTIRDDISKRIKAKHVFYVVDACYSGILVATRGEKRKTNRDIGYLQQIAKEPVRQVLTAGGSDQQVLDGGPGGHSVFTGRFLEILDKADDFITATEVSSRVKERVFSDANARRHVQTPKSGELFGLGDFIFMPSVTKQVGSIKEQVAALETELADLKDAEAKAISNKDEAARREVERQTRIAEAKLQAKKLEEERLKNEEIQQAKRKKEHKEMQEAMLRQQEIEAERLAKLQREVKEKRKQYKSSMISSLEEALSELQALDREIKSIRERYREELKSRIWAIALEYSNNFGTAKLKKDEFETEAEYRVRLAKNGVGKTADNKQKYQGTVDTIRMEYDKQIAPLKAQMELISKTVYTIYGHDGLKLCLGGYDADQEFFNISIASVNIQRKIYPYQHFRIVSEAQRQARQVGIHKNDIIIRYNRIDVRPMSNWNRLKQTVIDNSTTLEIDRNGKIVEFNLAKGNIGIDTYSDDYLPDLLPDQFIVNGDLYVPRSEARQFKQNFLNGFITAEVKVVAKTPKLSLVTSAFVVDESNDKRYNLFKSKYINMGNRLTYDSENHVYWIANNLSRLSFLGAEKFLGELEFKSSIGWQLPTLNQLKSIKSQAVTWKYKFYNQFCYTSSRRSNSKNHIQFRPSDGKTDSGDDERETVIAVATELSNRKYNIFSDRYITLKDNLVFDSKSSLVWLFYPSHKEFTYLEALAYLKQLQVSSLKGWRLPTFNEFMSLRDPSIPGVDARHQKKLTRFFYTSSRRSNSKNHIQFRPSDGKTDSGDDERESVIGVL